MNHNDNAKFGLALAGGGLKCVAYIGVIKAFEELNIKVNFLSGTSSGSLIAVMYAMGFSADEMKETILNNYESLTKINRTPLLAAGAKYLINKQLDIEGLIDGKKVEDKVNEIANMKNIKNIRDISIPFAIATVDTISTKECIFMSKDFNIENDDIEYIKDIDIGKAVRASMAFPGIFTPCSFDKYNFIDGGTKDNLPVKVLKDMGADKVLGLNFKLDNYDAKNKNFLDILLRTVDIFSLKDVIAGQKAADYFIEIDANNSSLMSFDNIEESIKIGYDTIMKNKDNILKLYN